jgi:spore germination protein YaaH
VDQRGRAPGGGAAGGSPPANGRRGDRRSRRRRRPSSLLVIVAAGLVAIAGAYLIVRTLDHRRPHGPYLIGAWTFGDRDSLRRAGAADAIDEVSADWLQSRADGSVVAPKLDESFLQQARKDDCKVFVTLTDYDETTKRFDHSISAAILASAASRRRHVAAVADWAAAHKVDGVDVDWEALTASQRGAYARFVEELAARLHKDGRRIAVDVFPKTSEPGGWDVPRAQDWKRLGAAVDEFRVMTYNYSGSWSGPGPLSPPSWMDRVLAFAESRVDPRKIVMGLGLYGREWREAKTTDLVWSDVLRIRASERPSQSRSDSGELVLSYRSGGLQHIAYFPDARAIDDKLKTMLERHPHIKGVYAWLMGQEDPAVWPVLHRRLQ